MLPAPYSWVNPVMDKLMEIAETRFDLGWHQGRAIKKRLPMPITQSSAKRIRVTDDVTGAAAVLQSMQTSIRNAVSHTDNWQPVSVVIMELQPHEYDMSYCSDMQGLVRPHLGDFKTIGKIPSINCILAKSRAGLIYRALTRSGAKLGLVYDGSDARNQPCIAMYVEFAG